VCLTSFGVQPPYFRRIPPLDEKELIGYENLWTVQSTLYIDVASLCGHCKSLYNQNTYYRETKKEYKDFAFIAYIA
jgi:hypothetical protein